MTIKMKIVQRYDFRYYDKPLPKGAIYGQDENGLFACYNWQNLGSPKNPCLKIWRPDPSNSRKNWIKWGCRREKGETAAKILSYYQNHRSKCLIDYGDQAHEVASKQDLRPDCWGGEVHYKGAKPYIQAKTPSTSLCYVIDETRTLDDIAKEQKGRLYLL